MSEEEDPSRRPPEDFVRYRVGLAKAESSAIKQFAIEKPFFSTGIVLGLALLAYRLYNVRHRPHSVIHGRTQELNQYLIYTRLYVCGTVISGGTAEMASEFYR